MVNRGVCAQGLGKVIPYGAQGGRASWGILEGF
jgi:hypothetical protein